VEERCWTYLLKNRQATASDLAVDCDVTEQYAQSVIDRIASDNWRHPVEGKKFDQGKPRYDLVPPEVEEAIAKVLTFGAAKYGERNWELGMAWGRPYAALRRHMASWWSGETFDPESGLPHTWHAACCLAFIIAFEQRKIGTDDRPTKA
ncbi:dATP/dGTP diphosphohydrolase domain-containing protein, partial [Arthrospira platensis SPKY2]